MADKEEAPSTPERKSRKAPSTPERIRRAKATFSKTAFPYILAAVVASTVMAWYFFVFVPAKLDYFVGLKFRTLAVASGHVGAKVQNMAKALRSVPGLAGTECPAPRTRWAPAGTWPLAISPSSFPKFNSMGRWGRGRQAFD